MPVVDQRTEMKRLYSDPDAAAASTPGVSDKQSLSWPWLLWERRRFLGKVLIYGAVASAILALVFPPRYESVTRIMPPDSSSTFGTAMLAAMAGGDSSSPSGSASGLSNLASDVLGTKDPGAIFLDMLRSRTVADELVRQFDLRKVYRDRYWQDARKDLAKRTSITADKKSGLITLSVRDRSPVRAQQLAAAYVKGLDNIAAQVSTSSARRERIFLEQRLNEVKQDLESISKTFSEYQSKNAVLDLPTQAQAMVESAAVLQGQLIAAQSELQGLDQVYTDSNVRVRSLRARVEELKSQLSKIGGNGVGPLDAASSATDLYPSLRQLPLLGVKWLDLYRDSKIQQTVYQMLTVQYELAKIDEAKQIPSVKVLDPADLPEKRSFPSRLMIFILGFTVTVPLAVALVLLPARWEEIDPRSPGKQLAMEVWTQARNQLHSFAKNGADR